MSAVGRIFDLWMHGYVSAHCPKCDGMLDGAQQPNGIWCDGSILAMKRLPTGQRLYVATCSQSATHQTCDRSHLYRCLDCGWEVFVQ